MYINEVIIAGPLSEDPKAFILPKGTHKAVMQLVLTRTYEYGGEQREETSIVPVIAWARTADFCTANLKKGDPVLVIGRLSIREYEKEGKPQRVTEVVAETVQALGKPLETRTGTGVYV